MLPRKKNLNSRSFWGISGSRSFLGDVHETPCAVCFASVVRSLFIALKTHCKDPSTDGRLSIINESCSNRETIVTKTTRDL